MRHVTLGLSVLLLVGCSSIVDDSHVLITLSFSDNSAGECLLKNKRENYKTTMPATISVRRSDDPLVFDCNTSDGRNASGSIPIEFGGMMAGNIILGGGIGALIDAETDRHRNYPSSFVITVVANRFLKAQAVHTTTNKIKTTSKAQTAIVLSLRVIHALPRQSGLP